MVYSLGADFIFYLRQDKGSASTDIYRVPALGGQPRKMFDDVTTQDIVLLENFR